MTDSESEKLIIAIDSMKKDGKTVKEIAKALNKSETSLYRTMKKYKNSDSKDGSDGNSDSPDVVDDSKPDSTAMTVDSASGRPKGTSMTDDSKVQSQLFKAFEEAAHKELLPLLKDEFVQRFKNGAILLHYDIRYRRDIEDMGYTWEEFLDFCFKAGYQLALNAHLEELEEEKANADMQNMVKAGVTMKTVEQIGKGEK